MAADRETHAYPAARAEPATRWRLVAIVSGAMALIGATTPAPSILDGMRPYPVGFGTKATDERRDPWVAVSDATVAPLLTSAQRHIRRVHRISIDYDGDGVADVAWMVRNRTQMGVLVRLGGSGELVLVYRADGRWSDQRLYRIDGRTIGIEFPESTIVALSARSGRPMVYYSAEGEN